MRSNRLAVFATLACALAAFLAAGSCNRAPKRVSQLASFELNSLDGILTESGIEVDTAVSSDGVASLKITAGGPTTVRLFELGDIDVENAKLVYRAMLRTKKLEGKVYLEILASLKGDEYFSRGNEHAVSGTTKWVTEEIPFIFRKGQNPENIKLNLVIEGKGTVWIDDIVVLQGPPIM